MSEPLPLDDEQLSRFKTWLESEQTYSLNGAHYKPAEFVPAFQKYLTDTFGKHHTFSGAVAKMNGGLDLLKQFLHACDNAETAAAMTSMDSRKYNYACFTFQNIQDIFYTCIQINDKEGPQSAAQLKSVTVDMNNFRRALALNVDPSHEPNFTLQPKPFFDQPKLNKFKEWLENERLTFGYRDGRTYRLAPAAFLLAMGDYIGRGKFKHASHHDVTEIMNHLFHTYAAFMEASAAKVPEDINQENGDYISRAPKLIEAIARRCAEIAEDMEDRNASESGVALIPDRPSNAAAIKDLEDHSRHFMIFRSRMNTALGIRENGRNGGAGTGVSR